MGQENHKVSDRCVRLSFFQSVIEWWKIKTTSSRTTHSNNMSARSVMLVSQRVSVNTQSAKQQSTTTTQRRKLETRHSQKPLTPSTFNSGNTWAAPSPSRPEHPSLDINPSPPEPHYFVQTPSSSTPPASSRTSHGHVLPIEQPVHQSEGILYVLMLVHVPVSCAERHRACRRVHLRNQLVDTANIRKPQNGTSTAPSGSRVV